MKSDMKPKRIPSDTPFGMTLRKLRKVAGLTQEELAERGGLSTRGLSDLERGVIQFPHRDTVFALVEALALGPEDAAELKAAARPRLGPGALAEPREPAARAALAQALPVGGFLGTLPTNLLVARETELSTLDRLLNAVAAGDGQLMFLAGEAGVGKTRLAQEVTLAAHRRGMLVVSGRCYEPQEAVAYYPFLDAVNTAVEAAAGMMSEKATQRWPQLLRLLPTSSERDVEPLEATPRPITSARGDEQQRLFWQASDFFQALAQQWPVALLLDDLQWADRASIDLLLHLARHTRTSRILLLGTYRSDELARQSPLAAALHDLSREGLATVLPVRRLSLEGTRALLATFDLPALSDEFVQALHARTEGNAFFTRQIVRALLERDPERDPARDPEWHGESTGQDGWDRKVLDEMELPESVRGVIGQRLSHLSAQAQQLLSAASILGQTFAFDDLLAMNEREEAIVEAALEEASEVGLVREAPHDRFGFSHALIQHALYRSLPSRKRQRLHRAAGAAIERGLTGATERERQGRAAELAYHFLAANEHTRALPYTLQAGDQAEAVYAHAEAERHYRAALELARELGDEARIAEAQERLGNVLTTLGRYDDALELMTMAAEWHRTTGHYEAHAHLVATIAQVHGNNGETSQGIDVLTQLLDSPASQGLSNEALAHLYNSLARLRLVTGDAEAALLLAERALDLTRAVEDVSLRIEADLRRAMALIQLGRLSEAEDVIQVLIPAAETTGHRALVPSALSMLASAQYLRGAFRSAAASCSKAARIAEQIGDAYIAAFMTYRCGDMAFLVGEMPRAREFYLDALDVRYLMRSTWVGAYPLIGLGRVCLAEGKWDEAERYFQEGIAAAESTHALEALWNAYAVLAERDLLAGDLVAARDRLEPALTQSTPEGDLRATILAPLLALALGGIGSQDQAEKLMTRALVEAREHNLGFALEQALRIAAWLAIRHGRWEEAEAALEECLALVRPMPYPYAEAKALYVYGLMHIQRGEPRQAADRLNAALAICTRLGERHYAGYIERALAGLEPRTAEGAGVPKSRSGSRGKGTMAS